MVAGWDLKNKKHHQSNITPRISSFQNSAHGTKKLPMPNKTSSGNTAWHGTSVRAQPAARPRVARQSLQYEGVTIATTEESPY